MEPKRDKDPGVGLDRDPGVIAHECHIGRPTPDHDHGRRARRGVLSHADGFGSDHQGVVAVARGPDVHGGRDDRPVAQLEPGRAAILGDATIEEVRLADEVRDEPVDRPLVDLARRSDLANVAVGHDRDPRRHGERLLLVVRHEHEGRADLAVDARELDLHVLAELEVQCPEWFVEQQHGRALGQRARQRDALGLSAGELPRVPVPIVGKADQLEVFADAPTDLRVVQPLHTKTERDVVGHRHVREQCVVLEDRVDVPLVRRQVVDALTLDPELARRERDEPADQIEGGRLPAPGRAEQAEELPGLDLERDAIERHGTAIALGDLDELDRGGGSSLRHDRDPRRAAATADSWRPAARDVRGVLWPTTRRTGMISEAGIRPSRVDAISISTARRPTSTEGTSTVVSRGQDWWAAGIPSKPVTAMSSGTTRLVARSASRTASASLSS